MSTVIYKKSGRLYKTDRFTLYALYLSYRCTALLVISLFTSRQMFSGLLSFNSSGSRLSGQSWKDWGRTNRRMASRPTEVKRESVVDGKGPPWCMEGHTSTPVGTPFMINRPARRASSLMR